MCRLLTLGGTTCASSGLGFLCVFLWDTCMVGFACPGQRVGLTVLEAFLRVKLTWETPWPGYLQGPLVSSLPSPVDL